MSTVRPLKVRLPQGTFELPYAGFLFLSAAQAYLGTEQELAIAVNDGIGLEME